MTSIINLDTVALAGAILALVFAARRDPVAAILASVASLFCSTEARRMRRRRDD